MLCVAKGVSNWHLLICSHSLSLPDKAFFFLILFTKFSQKTVALNHLHYSA